MKIYMISPTTLTMFQSK